MIHFASSHFLWGLALGLPLLILLIWRTSAARAALFRKFSRTPSGYGASATYSPVRQRIKYALVLIGFIFLILSLARPQWGSQWKEARARGIDILFALDVSRSMLAQDVSPSRLERSKLAIRDLLRQFSGDRLGLIPFAGSAFLQTPLTHDYSAFLQSLDAAEPGLISRGGTNIAAAIEEATAAFGERDNFKFLILISDGEDLAGEGIAAAVAAARENVRIFTVGVGSPNGARIPILDNRGRQDFLRDSRGNYVRSHLDENSLRQIAQKTGGFYVPLGSVGQGLQTILETGLNDVPREELETRMQQIPLERFQVFLGMALLALILETILGNRTANSMSKKQRTTRIPARNAATIVTVLLLAMVASPLPAQTGQNDKNATIGDPGNLSEDYFRTLAENEPENLLHRYNQGIAAFRDGQWNRAAEFFQEALPTTDLDLQADVFYNLGNSHFRLGEQALKENPELAKDHLEAALKSYRNTLELRPEDPNAAYNYNVLEELLEELEEQMQSASGDGDSDSPETPEDNQTDPSDSEGDSPSAPVNPDEKQGDSDAPDFQSEPSSPDTGDQRDSPEDSSESNPTPRMSQLEAEQILDALRQNEKQLPVSGLDRMDPADPPHDLRDW